MHLSIMLQGTASDVGKSVLTAGLCRIFYQDGLRCAPFKAQNMALNSGITPDGKEMGRAQIFQAEAANITPDVRMNPVLLKPTSDRKAQVVLMGKVECSMDAVSYHAYKPQLRELIQTVYRSLASEYDVVVLEGAGSPAEINLRDRDIVNMGMAQMAQCPVVLIADIDRGGVFASIYGTIALLEKHERARVKGIIINKFRGDVSLLKSGLDHIEQLTGVPVLGVLPMLAIELEDEDAVALHRGKYTEQPHCLLDIAVVQLPHISNFTDFNALAVQDDVSVRYVTRPQDLQDVDLIVLPGSKNTVSDLQWLQEQGLSSAIVKLNQLGVLIIGICGGYQMLGNTIYDDVESELGERDGLGLLDVVTHFETEKVTTLTQMKTLPMLPGIFAGTGELMLHGYEIHMGVTTLGKDVRPFSRTVVEGESHFDGAISHDSLVMGCYLHGIFDNGVFTRTLLNNLRQRKGFPAFSGEAVDYAAFKAQQFDILASAMREHIDVKRIYEIMREYKEQQECS